MVNYNYYLTQPQWDNLAILPCYRMPDGATGMLDLRNLSDLSNPNLVGDDHIVLAWGPEPFNPVGDLLGRGDIRSISSSTSMQDIWFSNLHTRPRSDGTLLDMLVDHLTNHGSPDGSLTPCLIPDNRNLLSLNLVGHPTLWSRNYSFGENSQYEDRLKTKRQLDFNKIYQDDPIIARKFLGMQMLNLKQSFNNINAWRQLVPNNLISTIASEGGPLHPSTDVSDSFDRADSTSLGASWDEFDLGLAISSNTIVPDLNNNSGAARHVTALSSDDHYAEVLMVADIAEGQGVGALTRKDNSATETFYLAWPSNDTTLILYSLVSGVATVLSSSTYTFTGNQVIRMVSSGSSQYLMLNDTVQINVSNTSISGNLYVGMRAYKQSASPVPSLDNFFGSDDLSTLVLSSNKSSSLSGLSGLVCP